MSAEDGTDRLDLKDVPLTPSVALEIVQDLFEHQRIWVRVALAAKVAEVHRQRGGRPGRQDSLSIVKGVLGSLKKDGKVENFAFGRWRWIGPATSEQDSDTLGTHAIPLISSVALDIVEDLFQQRNTWEHAALAAEVAGIHRQRAGQPGRQSPSDVVKKVLFNLKKAGKVENFARG